MLGTIDPIAIAAGVARFTALVTAMAPTTLGIGNEAIAIQRRMRTARFAAPRFFSIEVPTEAASTLMISVLRGPSIPVQLPAVCSL